MRQSVKLVLRILDSRWLSRVRALVFLGTFGVAAVTATALVLSGLLLVMVKALTHVDVVPLVFIGLGLFIGLLVLLTEGVNDAGSETIGSGRWRGRRRDVASDAPIGQRS